MSEWQCQGGEEGGGAGGAGQKLTLPLQPIHRTLQVENQLTSFTNQQKPLRPAVFSKLEHLVREMQDGQHGVPVRSQKLFLTSIPAAFMGYDLIEWLMDRLCIEDSLEAVHLANLLCQFGYYFPVNEQKNLLVKDDSSLYRFQSPYYWPSQHHTPDNIEYAIYLYKRAQRRRNIHGLEPGLPDYEMDALNNLKKILAGKWDYVSIQGDEQLKAAKDRKKGDKIINDSQEKAYWRVYRPPPGYNTLVESSPVPTREQRVKARRNNKDLLKEEIEFLKQYLNISRVRTGQVAESLLDYTDTFVDYDPLLLGVGPSNPWMSDDVTFWDINKPIPEVPTKKRVERWAISLEDTVTDPLGAQELLAFMKKEYCHENMRFWLSVQELKRGPGTESKIKKKVKEIWEEFLSPGAGAEINIDGKTMEETKLAMKNPTRHTFDRAADHVYTLLLKKDCYPRFLRSEHYKSLIANSLNPGSSRKKFFNFPVRKKPSQNQAAVTGPPGSSIPGAPKDFVVHMGLDPSANDQSLTSSREFDEACPWETDCTPSAVPAESASSAAPNVSRTRKVSNAGRSSHSTSDPPLPIDYVKQPLCIDEHNVNDEEEELCCVGEEDTNNDDNGNIENKIVDTTKKVNNDNIASSGGSSLNSSRPSGCEDESSTAGGSGSCPNTTAATNSSAAKNKQSVDSDNFSHAGGRRHHHKTGLGHHKTGSSGGKTSLRRVEEDILTEMDSMDDTICQDDDIPLLNCENKDSAERRNINQEDSLVMKFTRMNLTESCGSSSRKLSGTDTISSSRLDSTSSEATLEVETQQILLDDDDDTEDANDDCWINEDLCPWDDESLTPTWL